MQALEKIGVLEQDEEKGGRRITQSGQRDLDRKCLWCFLFKDSFSVALLWNAGEAMEWQKFDGGKKNQGCLMGPIKGWPFLSDKERMN